MKPKTPLKPRPAAGDANKLKRLGEWAQEASQAPAPAGAKARPWDGIPEDATAPYTVLLPKRLHAQLMWLGRRSEGGSVRKWVIAALERAVKEELK